MSTTYSFVVGGLLQQAVYAPAFKQAVSNPLCTKYIGGRMENSGGSQSWHHQNARAC